MEKERKNGMVLDVEENPSRIRDWVLFAIQHILAMLVACITVPMITGLPIGATIFAAGVGTLFYIFVTKRKSPVFLSSSFAYISPMLSALSLGLASGAARTVVSSNYIAVIVGMILVGVVYCAIALVIKFTGTGWINKLLPPVVVGPVIMVIGLGLAGSAINNVTGGTNAISTFSGAALPWQYTCMSILVAAVACVVTALCAHYGKNRTIGLIPFVLGMASAYVFALILTGFSYIKGLEFMRIIDFTIFTNVKWNSVSAWINCDWMFTRAAKQDLAFSWTTLGQVALLFIPVALVTICEHIGDHENLGNILDRDLLNDEPGMTRTLIGDGVATALSGAICGAANTTYGENVAVIGVSKVASVNVVILAALMSLVFGLFAPITLVLSTVPACVTGGVSLILYGFIASSGVKMLIKENVDFNVTKNILVASVILVAGIGGLAFGFGGTSAGYVIQISSTAVAMILGIFLNAILREPKSSKEEK